MAKETAKVKAMGIGWTVVLLFGRRQEQSAGAG